MANKEPKTQKGMARKLIGGNGRKKIGTVIDDTLNDPVTTVDKALGGRRKKGKIK